MEKLKLFRLEKDWLRSLSEIKDSDYINFLDRIKKADKEGVEKAKATVINISNLIKEKAYSVNELYEFILTSKLDFYNSKETDFYLVFKHLNNLHLRELKGDVYEKLAKVGFDFYYNYQMHSLFDLEKFTNKFSNEVKEYNRAKFLYDASKDIIKIINNETFELDLKIPNIDTVELEFFKRLKKENKDLTLKFKEFEGDFKKRLYQKDEKIDELEKKIRETYKDNLILEKEKHKLIRELEKAKSDLSDNNQYVGSVKKFVSYMENKPISQFDDLYWGDNYPALKVLFNFFQKYKMIEIPWSLFANNMCVGNRNIFNLNSKIFSKNDMGYLLDSIKPFFKEEFRVKKEIYNNWLISKIFIDNKELNIKYTEKFVRSFSKTKHNLKNEEIINVLVKQIQNRII